MPKKVIFTPKAGSPIGPYSQAIQAGNLLFVSGQVGGEQIGQGIEAETRAVMENLSAILEEAGAGFGDVVKCTIFLSDLSHFSAVNAVYGSYFAETPPARETVEVSRLPKEAQVEISCIAVLN
jgi:2-iminobutanoate/2-iminopropanoate deaminase